MAYNVPPIAVLPFPAEDDDLVVLNAKLSSYLYVVHVGNSIAAAQRLSIAFTKRIELSRATTPTS